MPSAKEILPPSIGLPALPRKLVPYTQRHKVDQFLGASAELRETTISFSLSVRPHETPRLPRDWFLLNFFIFDDFSKICPENSGFTKIGQKSGVLYMKPNIHFLSYLAHFFLEWEMFRTKVVEKIKTNILRPVSFFFSKIVPFVR